MKGGGRPHNLGTLLLQKPTKKKSTSTLRGGLRQKTAAKRLGAYIWIAELLSQITSGLIGREKTVPSKKATRRPTAGSGMHVSKARWTDSGRRHSSGAQ